jgi:leucyl aminopeptidase (aminopeptidase T)
MRALLAAASVALSDAPSPALDYAALADRIVRHAALQPGESVLLVTHPATFAPLVPHLRLALARAGAVDLGALQVLEPPEGTPPEALKAARERTRDALRARFANVDLVVMLPGAGPAHAEYAALTSLLGEGRRAIHFHWRGSGSAASAVALPGGALPAPEAMDAAYQRAVLRTDVTAVAAAQQRFEAALREGEIRVTTPLGTDLRFRVGDRPVNRQDGDASRARARQGRIHIDYDVEIPVGVVRVAPLEETVSGTIAFPPSTWNGQPVEGLRLAFEKGRVVSVTAASGREAVEAEMARGGEAARAFREFALGFNPELAVPADRSWIPYYGYGAGVVRLSLGDNGELGGAVRGAYFRWNFFADATVTVAGRRWVEDGRLTVP